MDARVAEAREWLREGNAWRALEVLEPVAGLAPHLWGEVLVRYGFDALEAGKLDVALLRLAQAYLLRAGPFVEDRSEVGAMASIRAALEGEGGLEAAISRYRNDGDAYRVVTRWFFYRGSFGWCAIDRGDLETRERGDVFARLRNAARAMLAGELEEAEEVLRAIQRSRPAHLSFDFDEALRFLSGLSR